jgi:hypothetical protein
VQLDVVAEALQHQLAVLAAQRADLNDAPGPDGLDDRGDYVVPEGKHQCLWLVIEVEGATSVSQLDAAPTATF